MFDEDQGGGRGRTAQGSDRRFDLEITFEEAVKGCEKSISYKHNVSCESCHGSGSEKGSDTVTCNTCKGAGRITSRQGFFAVSQNCPTCQGAGQVIKSPCRKCHGEGRVEDKTTIKLNIPAGVETGSRLRSVGNGDAGRRGGAAGDLYIMIHVQDHSIFQRDGDDLFCEIPISFVKAALGGEISVPTLEGKAMVKIPAGTQSGKVFRLRSKGVPNVHGRGQGDLNVRILVEVPKSLTSEQRKKLEEFSAVCDSKTNPEETSFFEKAKKFFS
jgi:molecular chaperone DnaJ